MTLDVDATLKSVLTTLAVSVYAIERPANSPIPALVYRRISEVDPMVHNGGRVSPERSRFQIIHVASSKSGLNALVESVKAKLSGNNTDFNACVPTEIAVEDKEADNIFILSKDYFIWM